MIESDWYYDIENDSSNSEFSLGSVSSHDCDRSDPDSGELYLIMGQFCQESEASCMNLPDCNQLDNMKCFLQVYIMIQHV